MPWSEENKAELRRLYDDGLTMAEIGAILGVSRNAVIGKVHRLGLVPRGKRMKPEQQEEKRKQHNAARAGRQRSPRQYERSKMQEMPTTPLPPFIGALNNPFSDLREYKNGEPNQCRYIADEPPGPQYLACGNETLPGESWCGHCHDIVFPKSNMTQAERAKHIRAGTVNHLRSGNKAA